jgi:putative DNA primase/helicase
VTLQALGESRFAAAEVYGRLANLCGDLDARALRRSDMFKMLTGGVDEITAERKYRDMFSFRPFATLVFSANEAPASSDQSDAYFDRWIILPFERRFEGTPEQDPHLLTRLTAPSELEGFLARSVLALRDLMARGRFEVPGSVAEAGRLYRERIDTVSTFVEERCLIEAEARVSRTELYAAYRTWCTENGRIPVSQQVFGPRLRQDLGDRIDDVKSEGVRGWLGITIAA